MRDDGSPDMWLVPEHSLLIQATPSSRLRWMFTLMGCRVSYDDGMDSTINMRRPL